MNSSGDADTPAPIVRARGLSFAYPGADRPAFGPLDLDLHPGEILLLLGPSGCGKSSLALCMNGAIPHLLDGDLTGELTVCGVDPRASTVPRMSERVGIVFQDPESQICALTLADETAFGMENLSRPPESMPEAIRDALMRAGLGDLDPATSTTALSGGQKQRLAMASVLAIRPRLLILDEPTAHLDPASAVAFFERLDRMRRESDVSILLIEHRTDEAARIADRVAAMDDRGRLIRIGPTRETLGALAGEDALWIPEVSDFARRAGIEPMPLSPGELADAILRLPLAKGALSFTDAAAPESASSDAGAASPLIRAKGIAYRYPDGTLALRSADLELRRGEIHALVGPNGGGKSTLALLLAGLLAPSGGVLEVEGRALSRKGGGLRDRLRVGCVFQNPEHQFVAFTVEEELAYGLKRRDLSPEEIKRRVEGMLERFRLAEFAGTHPFRLSGGQKRRLSVAAMLIEEPDLLILDEPTFGQDRETTRALTEEMRRLNDHGLTLLLIAHDMRLVAETAHRATALKSGETRFSGSPRALFAKHDLLKELDLISPPMAQLSSELRRRGIDAPPFLARAEAQDWLSRFASKSEDDEDEKSI